MKPEPLKGKIVEHCPCAEHKEKPNYNNFVWQGDLKLAVEWLKNGIDEKFAINWKEIHKRIDKAFEDVS